jgi:hypothetical protein
MMRARVVGGGGSTTTIATASDAPPARAGGTAAPAAEWEPVEVAAAEALIAISTLGRDVPYERVRELVEAVLRSHTKRQHLPVLIMWMRNHAKSRATGAGMGERSTPVQLLVALFECDAPVAMALLKDLPLYGSWRSLAALLELTDGLCADGDASAARFGPLQQAVHALFAKQMRSDLESLKTGGGVSNASKYAPHEGRNARLQAHGDAISAILFPDQDAIMLKDKDDKRYQLRRLYRKARASLNECNQHIAEVYLAGHRADELLPGMICGGTYAKLGKALLNVDKKGKERHADEARRALRKRILERLAKDPTKMPAPSDLAELAEKLFALHCDDSVDEGERLLLQVQYASAVRKLRQGIADRRQEITALIRLSALSEEEAAAALAAATPAPAIVAIDTSLSQKATLPTSCLLALVLADAQAEAPAGGVGGDGGVATGREGVPAILFGQEAHLVEVPMEGVPEVRLSALLEAAKEAAARGGSPNFDAVLALLESEPRLAGSDALLCSDFQNPEALTDAVRAWRGAAAGTSPACVVSCWRMIANKAGRRRERQPAWDPDTKRIDLVFLLDTTGSMGGEIQFCKTEINAMCGKLTSLVDMPVSVAFVSYKDFGDHGHLEACDWADTDDVAGMERLRGFIETLQASGGGDAPEDVAGGLEKVGKLFAARTLPSLRMCVLMTDAPCHGEGLNSGGDMHPKHKGVDQKERTLNAVRTVFGQGGVELLFGKCGAHDVDKMVKAFDGVFGAFHTFVDDFDIKRGMSNTVFKEKILGSLESCVAQALAPPMENLGLDFFAGTDFSVPLEIACRRLADSMSDTIAEVGQKRKIDGNKEEGGEEEGGGEGGGEESEEAASESSGKRGGRASASTLSLLINKLAKEDYDLVRATVSGVTEGLFKDYQWAKPLSEASMDVLQKSGLSTGDLQEAGYPAVVVAQFDEYLTAKMSR